MSSLFPALTGAPGDRVALRFGERSLTYAELAAAAGAVGERIGGARRVAVWATPSVETAVAVVGVLLAGAAAVPLNPKSGEKELGHIVSDSAPGLVLAAAGERLPGALAGLDRIDVDPAARGPVPSAPGGPGADDEDPALVVYTSGTTGPPKGAVLPRRALAHTLDALADAWQWTGSDVLVHGLPLFHVHGLVLGVLGPLRRGGSVRHLGRFSPRAWPGSSATARPCCSACRRCTTASPRHCPATPPWPGRWAGRGCWCRGRPRCPCTTTSGSRPPPGGASSSGTG